MKKTALTLCVVASFLSASAMADSFTMQPAPGYPAQTSQTIDTNMINSGEFNNSYSSQNQQIQARDYGFSANNRVEAEKEKTEAPKTAAEQGYGEASNAEKSRQEASDYFYRNTARQKGIVVNVPTEDVGVAKNKNLQLWLINWKGRLTDKGISADKVDFEASRLNKEDFEKWASRQLRYAEE